MSQNTHPQPVLDPEAQPIESEQTQMPELRFDLSQQISPEAMNTNADGLMDLLFTDVDRMLRDGVELPIEPEPEAQAPQPILPLESILPPKLSPRDLIPQPEPEAAIEATPDPEVTPEAASTPTKKRWNPIWWAVLFSSLLLSAGILSYLFRAQLTQVWLGLLAKYTDTETTVATAPADPKAQENADFLDYLGRALDRIAHRQQETAESEAKASPIASPSPSVAPSPNVVERVYVPIYPTQSAPAAAPAPAPATTSQPAVKPAPAAPLPSVPPTVPNIAANNNHMLLGVMELGDRSAALFEVNGIPQRIEIGAQIGSSGWTLVSISNQEAIVRRNGEVRSIYVGQKF